MTHRASFFARRLAALALAALTAGCGTWQHNGVPASSITPRVVERDLGGGALAVSADRSTRAER